jgi:hypothetical protein
MMAFHMPDTFCYLYQKLDDSDNIQNGGFVANYIDKSNNEEYLRSMIREHVSGRKSIESHVESYDDKYIPKELACYTNRGYARETDCEYVNYLSEWDLRNVSCLF